MDKINTFDISIKIVTNTIKIKMKRVLNHQQALGSMTEIGNITTTTKKKM